jgi:hypothetical protein
MPAWRCLMLRVPECVFSTGPSTSTRNVCRRGVPLPIDPRVLASTSSSELTPLALSLSPLQVRMLDRLAWSEMFENFLSTKYTAAKRFGLEGGETLIPGMKVRHPTRPCV